MSKLSCSARGSLAGLPVVCTGLIPSQPLVPDCGAKDAAYAGRLGPRSVTSALHSLRGAERRAEKAQQEPQPPWFFVGVTTFFVRQSTSLGSGLSEAMACSKASTQSVVKRARLRPGF